MLFSPLATKSKSPVPPLPSPHKKKLSVLDSSCFDSLQGSEGERSNDSHLKWGTEEGTKISVLDWHMTALDIASWGRGQFG